MEGSQQVGIFFARRSGAAARCGAPMGDRLTKSPSEQAPRGGSQCLPSAGRTAANCNSRSHGARSASAECAYR